MAQSESPARHGPTRHVTAAYFGVLALAVAGFFLVRRGGQHLAPAEVAALPRAAARGEGAHLTTLFHVLLALAAVTLAARVLGAAFRKLKQPPVIGEVVAGILLGPSLLGRVAPEAQAFLFPSDVVPAISVLAQVGVLLYMFLVGLELDTVLLRQKAFSTLVISHASIAVPFVFGAAVALWLYPRVAAPGVSFDLFALFMGVAMSITAFPVLARILTDNGLQRSSLGAVAIGAAAIGDVTAWCLLAAVVSLAQSAAAGFLTTLGLTVLYGGFVFLVLRPAVHWYVHRYESAGPIGHGASGIVFMAILLSSLATESIGVHAIFGAFLMGAIIPPDSLLAKDIEHKLKDVVLVLLLPAFFAVTGLHTQLGLLDSASMWGMCAAVVLVACGGKFGGTFWAARLTGLGSRDSAALGVLMNTRGLMELIVLQVGLDLGIISPPLFAMMVIMALVTTLMTSPVLHWLGREHAAQSVPPPVAA